jgi:hypothetical protein
MESGEGATWESGAGALGEVVHVC